MVRRLCSGFTLTTIFGDEQKHIVRVDAQQFNPVSKLSSENQHQQSGTGNQHVAAKVQVSH